MQGTLYLFYFFIIVFSGFIAHLISKKFKISKYLVMLLTGIFVGTIKIKNIPLINITNPQIIYTILIFSLCTILFNLCLHVKNRSLHDYHKKILIYFMFYSIIIIFVLSPLAFFMFNFQSSFIAIIFIISLIAIDPENIYMGLKDKNIKLYNIIKVESIFSIIFSLVLMSTTLHIIDIRYIENLHIDSLLLNTLYSTITAFATGVFFSLLFFKYLKKNLHENIFPIVLFLMVIGAYITAETLNGFGIISTLTIALIYINTKTLDIDKHMKTTLNNTSDILESLSLLLIGMIINITFSPTLLLKSLIFFLIFTLFRFIITGFFFIKQMTLKEKFFFTMLNPKGVTSGLVIMLIVTNNLPDINLIQNVIVYFMILSLLTSTILQKLNFHFKKA